MRKQLLLLFGIVLIGSLLRFYNLANLPPSLEWDEVATGYDANSILKTGRDQFGNYLPLTFRSLDDYKPPLYTYLTVASIAVFGWNDFAVRFPAALLGVLALVTTYGMVWVLFKNQKIALLVSLLLAISPWHINFSRLALETNSTIFFTTAATWAFLTGLKKGWWLIVSAILFGLDMYLYHNARVFVPLFGFILLLIYHKEVFTRKIYAVISLVVISFFLIRLVPVVTNIEGQMRFYGTSIFSNTTLSEIAEAKEKYANWRVIDQEQGIRIYGKLFHNQYVLFSLRLAENYLSHFNPNFWIFTDDYPRHHMPEMGVIYFIELPLIITGFYFLIKQQKRKTIFVLVAWILLAPIAASVTKDVPHSLRSEIMLPIFQISIGLGILALVKFFKTKISRYIFIGFISLLYFISVSFFLHKFLFHYSRETSQYWQYGRRDAALYAESIKQNFDHIVVSTRLEQPHVFFLYYLKYDPQKYLSEGGTVSGGWAESRNHFDKYEFREFDHHTEKKKKTLFIGLPKEFSPDVNILKKIYYLNGTEAIWIVKG